MTEPQDPRPGSPPEGEPRHGVLHDIGEQIHHGVEAVEEAVEEVVEHVPKPVRWTIGKVVRVAVLSAFAFVLVWNEFLIALMLTTSDAKTLPIVASELTQLGRDVPWGILNASVVLLSIPPLLLIGILSGLLNNAFRRKSN